MLTQDDVRRRRLGGALAVLVGAVLLVLAVMAFTGRLGATDRDATASDEAISAGAQTSASESPDDEQPGGDDQDGDTEPTEPAATETDEPDEPAAPVQAPLVVLNGGGIAGLAAQGEQAFQDAGWEVTEIGNYVGAALPQSTVFYPADDADAQAAAENLAEEFTDLVAEQAPLGLGYDGLVVVLTGDWLPGE